MNWEEIIQKFLLFNKTFVYRRSWWIKNEDKK